MLWVLIIVVGLLAAVSVHDAVRRPTLRRLAARNLMRRRGEAALVVTGCLLGAAIITASLLVGDSLRASLRDDARTRLGPVDLVVRAPATQLDAAERAIDPPPSGAAGAVAAVRAPVVALTQGPGRRAEPAALAIEIDFAAARALGGDPAITGLQDAGPTPRPGEAAIGQELASTLGAEPGDRIVLVSGGARIPLTVREVLPAVGIAGLQGDSLEPPANAFIAPGTLEAAGAGRAEGRGPEGLVLVSTGGGVFGGVDAAERLVPALEARLADVPAASVVPVKEDTLRAADEAGSTFTEMFGAIGAVAVLAGILLLVNVFVMLAEERKPVLGTLRALGLRRNHVMRAFGIEGGVYAVLGGALGALLGVAVGKVVVSTAASIFATTDEGIDLRFAVPARSVLLGFAVGAGISLLTVWATSARIARLNVIRAIRDLPAPARRRRDGRVRALGAVGFLAGAGLTAVGLGGAWLPALVGPVVVVAGAVALLRDVVPVRTAATVAAVAALGWALASYSALPDAFGSSGVPGFVTQGVVATAAAIVLVTLHSGTWPALVRRLGAGRTALAARLGVAYPLARPFRTAMQMGMFAFVIFGLVFLAVLSHLWAQEAPRYEREVGAGYEMVVDSSPGAPLEPARLLARTDVTAVAPLVRARPLFTAPRRDDPTAWSLTGFDERLLERGGPVLAERDARFPDDATALRAVLESRDLALVPDWFLQSGGPPAGVVRVGESITVREPSTGRGASLRVVGIIGADWLDAGVMVGPRTSRALLGDAPPSRLLVGLAPGSDPDGVAAEVTGRYVEQGADAESVRAVVDAGLSSSQSFMALSQGFVGLGLVIGIGGLGVVMIRAVRERRREIGMLRAMGFSHRTVRAAFLVESGFVALRGLLIGGGMSLVVCWLLVATSDALGSDRMAFSVPWAVLMAMLAATVAASVLATAVPATKASRIRPAVALRTSD